MKNKYIATKPIVKAGIRIAFGLLFTVGMAEQATAQTSYFSNINRDLDQYRSKALQEKVFLHLDRPSYACGETMWFKVYDVDGSLHRPLSMSKVAYVEVLDAARKPVLQAKVALQNGSGNGSFSLPLELKSGTYTVRAYTNWMKNYSPDFYFEQSVTILNTFQQLQPQEAQQPKGYAIQFFPEGGNLVAGVPNKVAFKAISEQNGKGITFTAELHDNRGNKVADFAPHKFGMGHFTFTPEPGNKYVAVVKLNDNRSFSTPLPDTEEQGYSLLLEDLDEQKLTITVHQKNLPGDQVYLLGHSRQMITFSESTFLLQGTAKFVIDKKKLADGITHFTLFSSQQQPVSQRLYFKSPENVLDLKLVTNQHQYNTRDKVTLDILAQAPGNEAMANLSMAVYKLDSLQAAPTISINSYMWLTSDLKGTIEEPAYYFSAVGASDKQAMDNLMLTHGWSRFTWKDILGKEPAPLAYVPEYNGHLLTGKVTYKSTGEAAPGVLTYLASPGSNVRFYSSTSAADGSIFFELKDFAGPKDVYVQSDFSKDSVYHFQLFNTFSEKYSDRKLPEFNILPSASQDLTQRHIQLQARHAYFGNIINKVTAVGIDSIPFYGQAPEQYKLDDYKRFQVMEEVLREYVTGVLVRKRRGKFHFMVLDRPNRSTFQNNPMVLLDGVPVFDLDKMMAFDPLKIKKVDAFTTKFYTGAQMYEGLVSFTTYSGDMAGFEVDPRALLQSYEGLQLYREFYAPTYETAEQKSSTLADFRNLLHWAPELKVQTGNRSEASFYTSDEAGTYLVVLQGVTENGAAGSKTYTFKVTPQLP
ncbi:hypothetical protein [Pontibacter burrus]|uniref:Macroglobulin domain-containing protein n=1 Tax=Pontibacter burrus TaxID=2704466 RepID=A0A6B3LU19_9BACT|nr:hypothetical protein [Pontibacter burrus]NEM97000.1 hypothetical protein [Pontibacter burrus]